MRGRGTHSGRGHEGPILGGGMFFSSIEDFSVVASLPNEIVPPVGHAPSPALIHSFGQTAATAS